MANNPRRRHKRHLKNYLIDRSFQLKYAAFLSAVVAVLSVGLGTLLWDVSQSLVSQTRDAVAQGQQVVELGKKVAAESHKVSEVVRMNIVKDPEYSDNPELLAAFQGDNDKKKGVIEAQQRALVAQATSLEEQAASIEKQQSILLTAIYAALIALVVLVGLAGIVFTHKVAGPIFKMTMQINELGEGHWKVPAPLRKGDELAHFFQAWASTVQSLRAQREAEIAKLDAVLEGLDDSDDQAAALRSLRDDLRAVLDG
jgi:nitrogen fixation/metabolism regulation signal transduction histidine kinase